VVRLGSGVPGGVVVMDSGQSLFAVSTSRGSGPVSVVGSWVRAGFRRSWWRPGVRPRNAPKTPERPKSCQALSHSFVFLFLAGF
jgi:hypothetical protein